MKLKFKIQPYQTAAVESVVDCFVGQPNIAGVSYRMDPGKNSKLPDMDSAFKNAEIVLSRKELLEKGYAARTINVSVSVVNSFLNWLGHREFQLTDRLELEESEPSDITRAEYLRLLRAARASSIAVSRPGAAPSIPSAAELDGV